MQNIDVTQETIEKIEIRKKEPKTKLQKTAEEKQNGFDPECTWYGKNR